MAQSNHIKWGCSSAAVLEGAALQERLHRGAAAVHRPLTHASFSCLGGAARRADVAGEACLGNSRLVLRANVAAIEGLAPGGLVRQQQAIASATYNTPLDLQGYSW